jgi:hypothetical protein
VRPSRASTLSPGRTTIRASTGTATSSSTNQAAMDHGLVWMVVVGFIIPVQNNNPLSYCTILWVLLYFFLSFCHTILVQQQVLAQNKLPYRFVISKDFNFVIAKISGHHRNYGISQNLAEISPNFF